MVDYRALELAHALVGTAMAMVYLLARDCGKSKGFARLACYGVAVVLVMLR